MGPNRVTPGGPDVDLKRPDRLKSIKADGNCLFRTCSSFILTGSENQHMTVRQAILDHMVRIAHLLLFHLINGSHTSIQSYIDDNGFLHVGVRIGNAHSSPYATN